MKKSILLTAIITLMLLSCASDSDGDFGYTTPPPTDRDMYSNNPGILQQPGGVAAQIESEQAGNSSFVRYKE